LIFSVADPDQGSGALLTPGSGMEKNLVRIRARDEHPRSFIARAYKQFFGLKMFCCGSRSGIQNLFYPGSGMENSDPGSGMNFPDPQHFDNRDEKRQQRRIKIKHNGKKMLKKR
jgi:hypothetical protein